VWWLRSWLHFASRGPIIIHLWGLHSRSHSWTLHLRLHHASLCCCWSGTFSSFTLHVLGELLFEFIYFNFLLIFDLSFHVLISLQKFVMFVFSELQPFIKIGLQFLFKSIHFILLLLDKFRFGGYNFLMSFLHILFSFFNF